MTVVRRPRRAFPVALAELQRSVLLFRPDRGFSAFRIDDCNHVVPELRGVGDLAVLAPVRRHALAAERTRNAFRKAAVRGNDVQTRTSGSGVGDVADILAVRRPGG